MAKLSQELERYFFEEKRTPEVTLANILSLAGERVFGFLFVILSLPSALPLPAPIFSIPFGVLMLLLAGQMILGAKRPWLPRRMSTGSIKLEKAQSIIRAGIPWLKKIEAVANPRLSYICTSLLGRVFIGVAIALMSISMMIPIPGTNTLPAIGIFITAFGLQEEDGMISLGGLFVCLLGGVVSFGIIYGGVNLLHLLKDWLLTVGCEVGLLGCGVEQ
ncbi:MAG: exopolysaccharide biosynthesis protein [Prochloron sp. SP5CPC1]|nr:exopolysaccharide biosynthesis protein [Candidatus Paraprochloron terpiosi SP5CPC1]